jgi:alpha-glucosidase
MIEAYTSLENKIRFYGDEKNEGANIPFNFEMISNVSNTSSALEYISTIYAWLENLPEGKQANWVVSSFSQIKI